MAKQYIHTTKSLMLSGIVGIGMLMGSCTRVENGPGLEYMPDMYRNTAIKAYESSPVDTLNGSARLPVSGTIPRNNDETLPFYEPFAYPHTNEGYEEAGKTLVNPYPASDEMLKLGEARYKIYCTPCHGEKGDGKGTLVQRDKFNGVPSYYSDNLKDLPEGKMYYSIYYGRNMMGSHASQLNYKERWAVIRWIQKLRADGLGQSSTATTAQNTETPASQKK